MKELEQKANEFAASHEWINDSAFAFKEGAMWQAKRSPWTAAAEQPPRENRNVFIKGGSHPYRKACYVQGVFYISFRPVETAENVTHWIEIPE